MVKEITGQTVTEYTIDDLDSDTEYVVYMLAYDNAGNVRKSNEVVVKTQILIEPVQVSAMGDSVAFLDQEGTVYIAAYNNNYGLYGNGSNEISNEDVGKFRKVEINEKIVKLAKSNSNLAAVIDEKGQIWIWGHPWPVLGDSDMEDLLSPTKFVLDNTKVVDISISSNFMLVLDEMGDIYFRGSGPAGDGSEEYVILDKFTKVIVDEDVKFSQVSAGVIYGLALDTEGSLWSWGGSPWGETGIIFGNGDSTIKVPVPTKIECNAKFVKIDACGQHILALDAEGHVWSWGRVLQEKVEILLLMGLESMGMF